MSDLFKSIGPVVIVDDDEQFRDEFKALLVGLGAEVTAQESGSHAVRFMTNQPWTWRPGMIFTDLVMNGMGGYQLIRRIQEIYPNRNIPVIVVSKLDAGVDLGEAEVAGAAGYLTKPVAEHELVTMVDKVMKRDKRGMIYLLQDGKKLLNR